MALIVQPAPRIAPEMFAPGIVSTEFNEFGGAFTPDGDTVYFARSVPRSYAYAIYWSHRVGKTWSIPEVAPFSGRYRDFDVIIPPDGQRMYFVSDRPIDGKRQSGYKIWTMERTHTGWSEPRPLGAPFDQFGFVWYISETRDGVIYFDVQPQTSPARVYSTRRTATGYTEPQLLSPEVNLPDLPIREPYIAPDDSFIVFDSGPGDVTSYDLYISYHHGTAWTPAVKLASLSSPARDYSSRITADGKWLYFTSERSFADVPFKTALSLDQFQRALRSPLNGLGNIYKLPIEALHAAAQEASR